MRSRLRVLPIVLVGMLLALSTRAGAQDATPVTTSFPVTPDPSECRVEPRTVDEMLELIAQAAPTALGVPLTEVVVPIGTPADESTRQTIVAVVRQAVACLSSGDIPRFFAFFTDDLVRRAAEEPSPLTLEDVRLLFAADPAQVAPDRPATLLAVTDVAVLADGRGGAFVVADDPYDPAAPPTTEYWILARVDGRWLLDYAIQFELDESADETPTP